MQLIQNPISLPTISVSPDALTYRDNLLLEARGIVPIDPASQQRCVNICREIRRYCNSVNDTHDEIKGPFVAKIDSIRDDIVDPLMAEVKIREDLLTQFRVAENQRVEQAERDRQAEIDRLERERKEAEQQAAALARQASNVPEEEQAMFDMRAEEARQAAEQANIASRQAMVAPLPEVSKAKGAATGQKMVIEIIDVKALYAARPELCRIKPNLAAIRSTCVPEMPVPGLKLSWTIKTTTRA